MLPGGCVTAMVALEEEEPGAAGALELVEAEEFAELEDGLEAVGVEAEDVRLENAVATSDEDR